MLVSALDEELARTDAHYGIDVFWKAFLANREGFRVGIPAVPLADLYDGCRVAIEKRGGEVRFRATLRGFRMDGKRLRSLVFDEGAEVFGNAFVFAVPQSALLELLGPTLADSDPAFAGLRHLHDSPITGIHFWFDRPVMKEPFLTLLDHTVQWIFNKTLLYAAGAQDHPELSASKNDGGQYLQLVVSASYDLVNRSRQEITDLALREVREVLPAARDAKLCEIHGDQGNRRDVFARARLRSMAPRRALQHRESFPGGRLDAHGLARHDGRRGAQRLLAAEAVLAAAGTPRSFLQPDLPAEGFSARWARNGTGRA